MVPRAIEDERAIAENQAWKGTDIGGVDHLGERHRRNLVRQDAFSAQDPSISDKVLGARPFPKLAPQVASDYQENPDPDSHALSFSSQSPFATHSASQSTPHPP